MNGEPLYLANPGAKVKRARDLRPSETAPTGRGMPPEAERGAVAETAFGVERRGTMLPDAMQVPAPPPPPPVPTVPDPIVDVQTLTQAREGAASVSAIYQGLVNQRKELRDQLNRIEDLRQDLTRDLRSEQISGAERQGLEARLKETDARISGLESQIAQADLAVARAAAIPGAIVPPPPAPRRSGPPDEVFMIPIVFTIFVLFPIAVAYARRIWRRGATVVAPIPREVTDRLEQLGQAVESIAVEVERIGEGQRFLTRVMGDQTRHLGQGAAQPIPVPVSVPVPVPAYTRETVERRDEA